MSKHIRKVLGLLQHRKQIQQIPPPHQQPTSRIAEEWSTYWKAQGQPWRTEPEIDKMRQEYLAKRRLIIPNIEQGIYPFKGEKLSRADVEWLLATHENGRGPVDWSDESQREREGLDLRGANLSEVDLSKLPLTRMRGGLTTEEQLHVTKEQCYYATVLMEKTNLSEAQLENANLNYAQLHGATLYRAQLENANLNYAHLKRADLRSAQLKGVYFIQAQLEAAYLGNAQLESAYLHEADLREADLYRAQLKGANLMGAQLENASLNEAQLEQADLSSAQLKRADLSSAQLERANLGAAQLEEANLAWARLNGATLVMARLTGAYLGNTQLAEADLRRAQLGKANLAQAQLAHADLSEAQLVGANLYNAHLEGTNLRLAQLQGTTLRRVYLEGANLEGVTLGDEMHVGPLLADAQWGTVNLAIVKWSQVEILGDEHEARQKKRDGKAKDKATRLDEYEKAVRANRQLAVALQAQGLNEDAARFAYRAQVLQKRVFWFQMLQQKVQFRQRMQVLGAWLFSWFLFLLAGYGYKPIRSVLAYLVIIFGFMGLYLLNAHFIAPHLTWDEALVLSVSSFHGRGFFTQNVTLGDTYARLAAVEAIVGLLIEISFIATFTQRFFGK